MKRFVLTIGVFCLLAIVIELLSRSFAIIPRSVTGKIDYVFFAPGLLALGWAAGSALESVWREDEPTEFRESISAFGEVFWLRAAVAVPIWLVGIVFTVAASDIGFGIPAH